MSKSRERFREENFCWNPFADQPHNVAPKRERFRRHFRYAGSYVNLAASNLGKALPVLDLYKRYAKTLFRQEVRLQKPFAVSLSPASGKSEDLVACLKELNVTQSLVRIPSWEKERLSFYEEFFDALEENGLECIIALLQNRYDVFDPRSWAFFLEEVFSSFSQKCHYFEIGHAWNRTKWGVWDYREYLKLARMAFSLADKYGACLIGPAVIDFEFHLYPPLLKTLPFDKVSSLLYVDRMGSPESKQFGWDAAHKVVLLKAIVDACSRKGRDVWITEMNWPLKGAGKYSPAAGKPNVSEDEQADYLVRYFVLTLATGYVERVYWWQLVAPGYGLIDSRGKAWRKRPAFFAMKTLVNHLEGSVFKGKKTHPKAEIFTFSKGEESFALGWTKRGSIKYCFSGQLKRVLDRKGQEVSFQDNTVILGSSPKYIFFQGEEDGL